MKSSCWRSPLSITRPLRTASRSPGPATMRLMKFTSALSSVGRAQTSPSGGGPPPHVLSWSAPAGGWKTTTSPTSGSPKRAPIRLTSTRWPTSSVGTIDSDGSRYGLTRKAWMPSARPSATTTIMTSSSSEPDAQPRRPLRPTVAGRRRRIVQQARLYALLRPHVAALAHARALADAAAQVVELRAPDVAAGGDLDPLDLRRVHRERALDADAERLLADREGLAHALALALDHDALEDLRAAARPLDDLEVHPHPVARLESGHAAELRALEAVDHGGHGEEKAARAGWLSQRRPMVAKPRRRARATAARAIRGSARGVR